MATRYVVFNTLVAAGILRDRISTRLGFPKEGTDIGRGYHAHPDQSRTYHFTNFRKHPSQNKWAVLINDTARAHLRGGVDTEEDLTNDWNENRPT